MPEEIVKLLMMDKQLLLGILMGTSHPILTLDEESRILSISPKAKEIFGFDDSDLLGQNLTEMVDPSYHSSILTILFSNVYHKTDEDTFRLECEFITKSKEKIPVEISIHRIVQEQLLNFVIIVKDLSEERKNTVKIQEEAQLFAILAEQTSSLIFVVNNEDHITYANSLVSEYLGYEPNEFINKNIKDFLSGDDVIKVKDKIESQEINLKVKGGNFDTFLFSSSVITKGKKVVNRLFNIKRPSELSSDELLEKESLHSSTITKILPDTILKLCEVGTIVEIHAGNPEDLIASADDLIFRKIEDVFEPSVADILHEAKDRAFRERNIITCKYSMDFPGAETKHFEARVIAVSDEYVVAIIRNISDQVRTQQQLIEVNEEATKAAKLKDEFMSVMSHEIRTPLNAVIGMTQLLIRKHPTPDQLELLNTIKFSGENLLKIINDILDYSKIKAEKVEFEEIDFNLRKLVKNNRLTHKNLAAEKGLKFKLYIDDDVPEWVKGDYTRLNQILNNLISNAIKFTEDGTVALDVYIQDQTDTQVVLLFEVSDTGIGIPQDKLKHIFDPFHQASSSTSRKFGGTGLGLSIIKNMVELQKGKIEVSSIEGEGSIFKVFLPFTKAPELIYSNTYSSTSQAVESEYKPIKDFKILYVEDVESNQLLIDCLCKEWGVELELANNGIEALKKVKEVNPHLILMDIQMPDMNGYEATEKIRALPNEYFKEIPIIALTAEVSEYSKSMIRNVGMNDYMLKPIDTDELYEKLSHYSNINNKKNIENQRRLLTNLSPSFNYVNFSKTEELYKNDTTGFIRLLNLLVKEFEGYHVQILKAVKERDLKGLSFVKHKVASTIQSFNLKQLAELLVKLQNFLNNDPKGLSEKVLLEECDHYFNAIIGEFHSKIKVASSIAEKNP